MDSIALATHRNARKLTKRYRTGHERGIANIVHDKLKLSVAAAIEKLGLPTETENCVTLRDGRIGRMDICFSVGTRRVHVDVAHSSKPECARTKRRRYAGCREDRRRAHFFPVTGYPTGKHDHIKGLGRLASKLACWLEAEGCAEDAERARTEFKPTVRRLFREATLLKTAPWEKRRERRDRRAEALGLPRGLLERRAKAHSH